MTTSPKHLPQIFLAELHLVYRVFELHGIGPTLYVIYTYAYIHFVVTQKHDIQGVILPKIFGVNDLER